jgi:hypothetical protein
MKEPLLAPARDRFRCDGEFHSGSSRSTSKVLATYPTQPSLVPFPCRSRGAHSIRSCRRVQICPLLIRLCCTAVRVIPGLLATNHKAKSDADMKKVETGVALGLSSMLEVNQSLLDHALYMVASDELNLLWCLLAEGSGVERSLDERIATLTRRKRIFNLMRSTFSVQRQSSLPLNALMALGVSSAFETLLGNPKAAAVHQRALIALIGRYGVPPRDEDYPGRIMLFNILLGIGTPALYCYRQDFSDLIQKWQDTVKKLQKYSKMTQTRHLRSAKVLQNLASQAMPESRSGLTKTAKKISAITGGVYGTGQQEPALPNRFAVQMNLAGLFTISKS